MKTLIISKPVYDYIIPLEEFIQEKDKFIINSSIKTMNNVSSIIAITLAKYGIETYYTGVVGQDDIGNTIKNMLKKYNINIDCIETSFNEQTCINYKIYNKKNNTFTNIFENSVKTNLMKYKYEFIPDAIVMDDLDYSANMAAINNYPNANLIFIANKFTNESSVYLNKCKYVICDIDFASNATGVYKNLNKPKEIINLYQKFIDVYKTNLIIKLNNFDFLYCINDEVRLIKNVNQHLNNKENVFISVLCYFLINTNNIENSIKYTNKVMLECNNDIDMINNIPNIDKINDIMKNIKTNNIEVLDNIDIPTNKEGI